MPVLRLLFIAFTFFLSASAQAALITVNDGDTFNYDENDTYQFTGALSSANPIITYGAIVEPGEIMSFVVNAPAEFDLLAVLTTGPNATGTVMDSPSTNFKITAGTSFDFLINGNFLIGLPQWLTLGVESEAIAIIDEIYGGALEISSISSSGPYGQTGGGTDGGGTGGNGSGSGSVPEPSTILLLGVALLGFVSIRQKSIKM